MPYSRFLHYSIHDKDKENRINKKNPPEAEGDEQLLIPYHYSLRLYTFMVSSMPRITKLSAAEAARSKADSMILRSSGV